MSLVSPCPPPGARILACQVFRPELEAWGLAGESVEYLEQGLHRYPQDLRLQLEQRLAALEADEQVSRVILLYGQCGGGLTGLTARRVELVVAAAPDCIPLLTGQPWSGLQEEEGEAFYLSPGWIEYGKTPFSEYFITREKFGHEEALWAGRQMLAHYQRVVLVKTVAALSDYHRYYARAMAQLFGLSCQERQGRAEWLKALVAGRPGPGVMVAPAGTPLDGTCFGAPASPATP